MKSLALSITPSCNLTESNRRVLQKRTAYVAAHSEYFAYLHQMLDVATLPASDMQLPNLTTIAAMVDGMRAMHPAAPKLNGVVLGRMLHRVLPGLLTWHGGRHTVRQLDGSVATVQETTVYRFPLVQRCRVALQAFLGESIAWSNECDQWRWLDVDEDREALGPKGLAASRSRQILVGA